MAIEKMTMMNVVGRIENVNEIAKEIILLGNVDIINALNEIRESHFTLSVEEENVDEIVDMSMIQTFEEQINYDDVKKKIDTLKEIYKEDFIINKKYIEEPYDFLKCIPRIEEVYSELIKPYNELKELEEELKKIDEYRKNFIHMKGLDIDVKELIGLKYFTFFVGVLSKEDRIKLKKNYENISAIVLHTGSSDSGEVYLIITPKELEAETNRILRSLNFRKLELPEYYTGTPKEIIQKFKKREEEIKKTIIDLKKRMSELKEKNENFINRCCTRLRMEERIKQLKEQMVSTNNFFYLTGWVPRSDKAHIKNKLSKYKDLLIVYKNEEEITDGFRPPTKLNNPKLFSPFEFLVKMYGIPSYNELDPTIFLSLTYMILFGAMFGDSGQGFILFLLGIAINKGKNTNLIGKILSRLGISSMIFGVLYGSVFGFEHIIPAILIKPFENINTMLFSAIGLGIFFFIISYGYSIANSIKQRDLKEGAFGRNGVAGLLFYVVLLLTIGSNFIEIKIISTRMGVIILGALMIVMTVKEPLTNLILKKRPLYHETPSNYYIESGFDTLETLLNMLSSTVSFIRVGAFALTHVGLFIAFETIAELLGNTTGSILILILGNIIIIGLEGLIVSIQGLRLEYYELFSKYYNGEGVEFKPIKL
ncbi:V-type ATP synthase subunit I [Caldisalinibacter kiritimatiensis]|uniref:V-type ATP synthase subunit I n=2 Tax=Caldisalinibacter kiritimatiensis TaxID=1304284 RepID=R1CRS1_9FIRM|nr:V-type ATP synthase subunit I [Caldisalinibacter kiritimatiensis]